MQAHGSSMGLPWVTHGSGPWIINGIPCVTHGSGPWAAHGFPWITLAHVSPRMTHEFTLLAHGVLQCWAMGFPRFASGSPRSLRTHSLATACNAAETNGVGVLFPCSAVFWVLSLTVGREIRHNIRNNATPAYARHPGLSAVQKNNGAEYQYLASENGGHEMSCI